MRLELCGGSNTQVAAYTSRILSLTCVINIGLSPTADAFR